MKLISDTLTVSSEVTASAVTAALAPLRGIGPALIAAGHLESAPVVLVSESLHVSITVVTGAAVMSVDESLNPVPGGAGATTEWTLYLPNPSTFATVLAAAAAQSSHLSVATPPADSDSKSAASTQPGLVNLSALDNLRASS